MEALLASLPLTVVRTFVMTVVNQGVRAAVNDIKKLIKEHRAKKAAEKRERRGK